MKLRVFSRLAAAFLGFLVADDVTFGSALAQFGIELKAALVKHDNAYYDGLKAHFDKHLSLLK